MNYTKIILCGKRCTGKTTLMWNLQQTLNWPLFSVSEYLRDLIRMYHFSPEDIEKRRVQISRDIDSRMMALLRSDNRCIIDARVFGLIDQSFPRTFKLLLTADDRTRINRSSLREKSSVEKAEVRLMQKEEAWIRSMKDIYGQSDFFNPAFYDLVLDTSNLKPYDVLKKVFLHMS